MVEVLNKKETMLDRVLTMKPMPRVERLRGAFLSSKRRGDITKVRTLTRIMKETEGEPMVTRRAKAFAAVVREMPINIAPDELFVGYIASTINSGSVGCWGGVGPEKLLGKQGFILSDDDMKELREEIIPFWSGPQGKYERTHNGLTYQRFPPEIRELLFVNPEEYPTVGTGVIDADYSRTGHLCHTRPNYEKVLEKGFQGIKKEAEERLNRFDLRDPLTDPDELRKVPFLKGVVMAMEAATEIGKRFAVKARELAEKEEDTKRKAELLKLAEVCDQVPANPARTFYEALQSVWFTHILIWWDTPDVGGISPSRVDRYLYPYYERDIREGRLTKEEAQELVDCWFIKFGEALGLPFAPSIGLAPWPGDPINHHMCVGGLKPDGSDATNELSYMFIEAMMHTTLTQPTLGVRIHSKTPDALLIKASQLCALGTGHPAFFNDEAIVPMILGRAALGPWPVTIEQARMSSVIGCVEPQLTATDSGHTAGGYLNLTAPLELALTNGWNRFHHRKMGLETGDPKQFKTFEEIREAYKKQLVWLAGNLHVALNINELVEAELEPTAYTSALLGDCIEKGIPREAGGCRYNYGDVVLVVGSNDVGDSLAAIKKLVFEDKKITMGQLCDALDKNFEGYEELRQMLLKAPKFGNDDDYADEQSAWVMHVLVEEVNKYPNTRGGHRYVGQIPMAYYMSLGKVTGALPSGRQAGEPLSDGISPTRGSDVNGPTAVFKSVGKMNNVEIYDGQAFNFRLDPAIFKVGDGFKRLADLLRVFIDQKIEHVQINVVSSDTLRAAQKEPDKYQDLMVKVAGWNAFFVRLPNDLQDSIIARTEHRL